MQDIEDARAVAEQIGIEFRVVNLMRDYRRLVVDYLLDGYARGLTPNPDVMCNRAVKFGVFRAYAAADGFTAVATGHYARRSVATAGGKPARCWKAPTRTRTSPISSPCSPRSSCTPPVFPSAISRSPRCARLAAEPPVWPPRRKKDSQGICFIGEVKMQDFLRAYVPDHPGPIVRATDGREIGRHRGLHYYTIGQRKGIRHPSNTDHKAYVVVGKRAADHALLVAFDAPDAPGLLDQRGPRAQLSWIGRR